MVPVIVVVVFSSRCGATETLALNAAVGAVQQRGQIRMRRLTDDPEAPPPPGAECAGALARMRKEYVPPAEADLLGADALVLAAPEGATATSAEWAGLLGVLRALDGRLSGKVAAVVGSAPSPAAAAFLVPALEAAGLTVVRPDALPDDGIAGARLVGRQVVIAVRERAETS